MQEHIKWLKKEYKKLESMGELGIALHIGDCIQNAESLLEKEKEAMCEFAKIWDKDLDKSLIRPAEDCFDETFKTKERWKQSK